MIVHENPLAAWRVGILTRLTWLGFSFGMAWLFGSMVTEPEGMRWLAVLVVAGLLAWTCREWRARVVLYADGVELRGFVRTQVIPLLGIDHIELVSDWNHLAGDGDPVLDHHRQAAPTNQPGRFGARCHRVPRCRGRLQCQRRTVSATTARVTSPAAAATTRS